MRRRLGGEVPLILAIFIVCALAVVSVRCAQSGTTTTEEETPNEVQTEEIPAECASFNAWYDWYVQTCGGPPPCDHPTYEDGVEAGCSAYMGPCEKTMGGGGPGGG